jgi:argininosuccinate lyase
LTPPTRLMLALAAMTGMVGDMTANRDTLKAAAASGFSTATDLADWLVRALNLPFREAHHVTGALVAHGRRQGLRPARPVAGRDDRPCIPASRRRCSVLGVENSVRSRMSYGGTAPDQVRAQSGALESRGQRMDHFLYKNGILHAEAWRSPISPPPWAPRSTSIPPPP